MFVSSVVEIVSGASLQCRRTFFDSLRLILRLPRHLMRDSVVGVAAQLWSETVEVHDSLPTPRLLLVCTRPSRAAELGVGAEVDNWQVSLLGCPAAQPDTIRPGPLAPARTSPAAVGRH